MKNPLLEIFIGAAAITAAGYFLCKYIDDGNCGNQPAPLPLVNPGTEMPLIGGGGQQQPERIRLTVLEDEHTLFPEGMYQENENVGPIFQTREERQYQSGF